MHMLERLLLETAAAWGERRHRRWRDTPVIGAVDENFFERMMSVFMDFATGYLFMEEVTVDRSFDTW